MTETEWLVSDHPGEMLDTLIHRSHPDVPQWKTPGDHKLRCVLEAWKSPLCGDERHCVGVISPRGGLESDLFQEAVNITRKFKPVAAALLREIIGNPHRPVTLCGMDRKPFHNQFAHVDKNGGFWLETECPTCAAFRTSTILALARAAYEERAERECGRCKGTKWIYSNKNAVNSQKTPKGWFEKCRDCHGTGRINDGTLDPTRLAVLADALEDAGCDNADILNHLRGRERCPKGCDAGWHPSAYAIDGKQIKLHCSTYNVPVAENKTPGWIPLRGPHVVGCHVVELILGQT